MPYVVHSWSNWLFILACSGLHVPRAHIGVDRVVLLTEGILMTQGFFPKITLPTRFSDLNGTLIDNVICDPSVQNQSHVAENIN